MENILIILALVAFALWRARKYMKSLEVRLEKIEESLGISEKPETRQDDARKGAAAATTTAHEPWSASAHSRPRSKDGRRKDDGTTARKYSLALDAAWRWASVNWTYAAAALCLALAGIFSAQYAAEQGVLSPAVRTGLAALFGAALICMGEIVRRRSGDTAEVSTAYLPSVFSSAGIITLFGAILTAHLLYALIGEAAAFAGLAAIASTAILMGWFYGPLLVVAGLLGATATPFLVGSGGANPGLIYAYLTSVALSGLAINAVRAWPVVTSISAYAPLLAGFSIFGALGGSAGFTGMAMIIALAHSMTASRSLFPRISGPSIIGGAISRGTRPHGNAAPHAQQGLARRLPRLGLWGISVIACVLAGLEGNAEMTLSIGALTGLVMAAAAWSRKGAGAADMSALAFAGMIILSALKRPFETVTYFVENAYGPAPIGPLIPSLSAAAPLVALVAAAAAISAMAVWQSLRATGSTARNWAIAAAASGPVLLSLQEAVWRPGEAGISMLWAGMFMAIAAIATWAASSVGRLDGADRSRASIAALTATTMIALSLFVILTEAALSIALGVLILGAATLGRLQRMDAMFVAAQAGAAILVYRAIADPGLYWAMIAPWWETGAAYGLTFLLLCLSRIVIHDTSHAVSRAALEGAATVTAGAGLSVMLLRGLEAIETHTTDASHMFLGLMATTWLIVAVSSLRTAMADGMGVRAATTGRRTATIIRCVSALSGAGAAAFFLLFALADVNPLLDSTERVWGPPLASSLLPGYLLPGLVLILAPALVPKLARWARWCLVAAGSALGFVYAWLSVAHLWRGPRLADTLMSSGELWSYTALLILLGAGIFLGAIFRGSRPVRLAGMGVLVAALAKVFFVDVSDLDGLLRAGSFLAMGFALAGMAWLNRLASREAERAQDDPAD